MSGRDSDWVEPSRGFGRGLLVVGAALALVVVTVVTVVLTRPPDAGGSGLAEAAPSRVLPLAVPPALPGQGSLVDARIGRHGRLSVVTWIRSATPLAQLQLSLPDVVGLPATARAASVRVAGDRRFVTGPTEVHSSPQTYTFARPSRLVFVSYRLLGVAERRSPSAGRALLRATRLDLLSRASGPVRVRLHGAAVLSAACLPPGGTATVPCGAPNASESWRVELRGADRHHQLEATAEVEPG